MRACVHPTDREQASRSSHCVCDREQASRSSHCVCVFSLCVVRCVRAGVCNTLSASCKLGIAQPF